MSVTYGIFFNEPVLLLNNKGVLKVAPPSVLLTRYSEFLPDVLLIKIMYKLFPEAAKER